MWVLLCLVLIKTESNNMKKYIEVNFSANGDVFLKHEFLGSVKNNPDFEKLLMSAEYVVKGSVNQRFEDLETGLNSVCACLLVSSLFVPIVVLVLIHLFE